MSPLPLYASAAEPAMHLVHRASDALVALPSTAGHSVVSGAGIFRSDLEIPDIKPDYSSKPVKGMLKMANTVFGGITIGMAVAIAIGLLVILFGSLSSNARAKGWKILGVAVVVMAIFGSLSGFMTFGMGIQPF